MFMVVVHDTPAPQGSKRAIHHRTTGKIVTMESNPAKLRVWRDAVRDATVYARGHSAPLEGGVLLAVTFTMHKPVSAPKRKFIVPAKKPDVDKLLRSTMDGLKAGGAYRDDAQVVELTRLAKYYPVEGGHPHPLLDAMHMVALAGTGYDILDSPGAVIRIASMDEFPNIREGWR